MSSFGEGGGLIAFVRTCDQFIFENEFIIIEIIEKFIPLFIASTTNSAVLNDGKIIKVKLMQKFNCYWQYMIYEYII